MAEIHVQVVRVRGTCNAELKEGEPFSLSLQPQKSSPTCRTAFASLIMNAGRLKIHEGPIYISCPDPGTGEGGNVLFKLTKVEDHAKD